MLKVLESRMEQIDHHAGRVDDDHSIMTFGTNTVKTYI